MLLLLFGRIPRRDVPRLRDLALRLPVRIVQVMGPRGASKVGPKAQGTGHPVAVEQVHDLQGHLRQGTLAPSRGWVLIRPDAYVAGGGQSGPTWRSEVAAMLLKASGETGTGTTASAAGA